MHNDNNKQAFW